MRADCRRSHPGPGPQHRVATVDELWVRLRAPDVKRLWHPEIGLMHLLGQLLLDADQSQSLLVFTAAPGSDSYEKLRLLAVLGARPTATGAPETEGVPE